MAICKRICINAVGVMAIKFVVYLIDLLIFIMRIMAEFLFHIEISARRTEINIFYQPTII